MQLVTSDQHTPYYTSRHMHLEEMFRQIRGQRNFVAKNKIKYKYKYK